MSLSNDNQQSVKHKSSVILDEHMIWVPKSQFGEALALDYDLYVRIGQDHFVRVARQGELSNVHRMSVMKSEKVEAFFIHRGEHNKYIGQAAAKATICNMAGQPFFAQVDNIAHVMQAVYEQIRTMGLNKEAHKYVREMSGLLVELVQVAPPSAISFLTGLGRISEAHVKHAMASAILSLVVAKHSGMNDEEMQNVAMAALMHDVGMLKLAPETAAKCFENMTAVEREAYRNHAYESAAMLRQMPQIPDEVVTAVYEHHENELGQGFPRSLVKGQISKIGQIIALVDYFCELTLGDAQHNDIMKPINALNFIENIQGQPYSNVYFGYLKKAMSESYTPTDEKTEDL